MHTRHTHFLLLYTCSFLLGNLIYRKKNYRQAYQIELCKALLNSLFEFFTRTEDGHSSGGNKNFLTLFTSGSRTTTGTGFTIANLKSTERYQAYVLTIFKAIYDNFQKRLKEFSGFLFI